MISPVLGITTVILYWGSCDDPQETSGEQASKHFLEKGKGLHHQGMYEVHETSPNPHTTPSPPTVTQKVESRSEVEPLW